MEKKQRLQQDARSGPEPDGAGILGLHVPRHAKDDVCKLF